MINRGEAWCPSSNSIKQLPKSITAECSVRAKGIIFDFDGPIFDGRSAAIKAIDQTIEKFGPPKTDLQVIPLLRPKQLISLVFADSGLSASELDER
jgi:hypothetical protein